MTKSIKPKASWVTAFPKQHAKLNQFSHAGKMVREREKMEKKENRRKPIRQQSTKMVGLMKLYAKLRVKFLTDHPFCERCMVPGYKRSVAATQVHHKRGRGRFLLDTTTWMAVCHDCHRWITDHPKEAAERGWVVTRHERREA